MGGPWEDFAQSSSDGPWNDYRDSLSDAPKQGGEQWFSLERALLTNDPTSGMAESFVRGIPSTLGAFAGAAAAAPTGPGAIAAGALGGAGGEGIRQNAVQMYAAAKGRPLTSPYEVASNMGIQGALQGAGAAIGPALSALKPAAVKVGAQGMRAMAGIPEKAGAAVLRDPEILLRAAPLDEAGANYAAATGGLKSGAEASRSALGQSFFSGEGIANKFDELFPKIADDSIDTQTALALRQRTMKAIEDLPFKQRDLRGVLSNNIEKLDELLERRLPDWAGARGGYREAKIAEEFSSLLPLNKNLSPNVLRTTVAMAGAAKGLAEGRPWLALGLPFISPAVYGTALKGAALAGRAAGQIPAGVYKVGPQAAAGAGAASLADAYARQRYAR